MKRVLKMNNMDVSILMKSQARNKLTIVYSIISDASSLEREGEGEERRERERETISLHGQRLEL